MLQEATNWLADMSARQRWVQLDAVMSRNSAPITFEITFPTVRYRPYQKEFARITSLLPRPGRYITFPVDISCATTLTLRVLRAAPESDIPALRSDQTSCKFPPAPAVAITLVFLLPTILLHPPSATLRNKLLPGWSSPCR